MRRRSREKVLLSMMKPGEKGEVASFLHAGEPVMRRLAVLGFLPGEIFTLERRRPDYLIRFGYTRLAMNGRVAAKIMAYKIAGTSVKR